MSPPKPLVSSSGAGQRWARLDVNGDGRISGSEGQVDADFKAKFASMDANRDGFVTGAEYRAQIKGGQQEPEEEERND